MRPHFERWFTQSFDGIRAELGDIELRWNPSDDTVSFTATDVVVFDRDDAVVQRLDLMRATTTKASILDCEASLWHVEIIGGEVTWRKGMDGAVLAGLGTPDMVGGFGPVYRGPNRVEQRAPMDWLRLSGCGVIRDIGRLYDGDIGTSPKFDLDLSDVRLDLTPIFEAPFRMRSVSALGELDLDARSLSLDRFAASFSDFSISTQARIESGDDGLKLVKLKGKTDSPLTAQNLLSLWPVKSADAVRRWIDRSVLGGSLHDVQFDVALDEVFFTAPVLTSDRLQLDFNVRDGVVRYISTMDPLTEAYGSGRIDGNRFGFVLERGRINGIEIVGGDVDIPRLMPKGGDILITTQGLGDAQSLLGLINQPPFLYMDKYGVDPEGFSGTADVTLSIKTALAGIL